VLNEYYVRFVEMLSAARRLDASEKLDYINIVSVPHLKKREGSKIVDYFKKMLQTDTKVDAETIKRDRQLLLKKLKGKVL